MFHTQWITSLCSPAATTGRRCFLAVTVVVLSTFMLPQACLTAQPSNGRQRPNILYIMTDQQHAGMLSCTGNNDLRTPAMDSLSATGARFERAYCTNAVCMPSRVSMMTGHMPSHFGIRSNTARGGPIPKHVLKRSMGWIFRRAGYDTAYGGKTDWVKGITPRSLGFRRISRDEREELADACARFIRADHKSPFLLVASFINPHDICFMAIDDYTRAANEPAMYPQCIVERQRLGLAMQLPQDISRAEFFRRHCPALPDNYEIPPLEPECITERYLLARPFREHARRNWSDEQWRLHRWAYCRLTEMVDSQIGKILDTVREAGLEESTVIVFASDHGDLDAAHRLEHKSILYEEAVRVPFIVSYKGVTRPGLVDTTHLVSAGLDLIPTLCDYAGIEPPSQLLGRSVRPLAESRKNDSWRDQVVVESQDGRMLRTDRFKYNVYANGKHREQLIDLQKDPGEMVNLAENPKYKGILNEHRRRLRRWIEETDDEVAKPYVSGSQK